MKNWEQFNENTNNMDTLFTKFSDDPINTIKELKSSDELVKLVFDMTCGHHFPFNPINEIREEFRSKIDEFLNTEDKNQVKLSSLKESIKGDWKDMSPPPGAMN